MNFVKQKHLSGFSAESDSFSARSNPRKIRTKRYVPAPSTDRNSGILRRFVKREENRSFDFDDSFFAFRQRSRDNFSRSLRAQSTKSFRWNLYSERRTRFKTSIYSEKHRRRNRFAVFPRSKNIQNWSHFTFRCWNLLWTIQSDHHENRGPQIRTTARWKSRLFTRRITGIQHFPLWHGTC